MLKELFTTDVGLMSLGVIVVVLVIAGYLLRKFSALAASEPGKEGWN